MRIVENYREGTTEIKKNKGEMQLHFSVNSFTCYLKFWIINKKSFLL